MPHLLSGGVALALLGVAKTTLNYGFLDPDDLPQTFFVATHVPSQLLWSWAVRTLQLLLHFSPYDMHRLCMCSSTSTAPAVAVATVVGVGVGGGE